MNARSTTSLTTPLRSSAHHRRTMVLGAMTGLRAGANYATGMDGTMAMIIFEENPVEHGHSNRNKYDRDAPTIIVEASSKQCAARQHDRMDEPPMPHASGCGRPRATARTPAPKRDQHLLHPVLLKAETPGTQKGGTLAS